MATELTHSLASEGTRHQVESLLRGALREPVPGELDALLLSWIDEHPGPLTAICRHLGAVSVTGWDALDADIAALAARGTLCSAIGIELSDRHEGDGPTFKVSLYSDRSFPFSTSDRAAILAVTENDEAAWQDTAEADGSWLICSGLEELCGEVTNHPDRLWSGDGAMPESYPDYFIGVWYLYLRVNQSLGVALDDRCLPYPMPVLVSGRYFGLPFDAVQVPEKALDEWAEPHLPPIEAAITLPESEAPEAEAHEVSTTILEEPQAELATDAAPATPTPSRGWPWRKSASNNEDAADSSGESPIKQRRRGPASFASG